MLFRMPIKYKVIIHLIEKIILLILGVILFIYKDFFVQDVISGYLLLKFGIGINIYLIIKSRKIKPVAILFLFLLTYQLNLIAYYRDSFDISGGFDLFDKIEYYNNTEWIHVLFIASIALFFPLIKKRFYFKDKIILDYSKFNYWVTFALMTYISVFGVSGEDIFAAGGYGKVELEAIGGTSIFEYFLVLVPLIYIFAGTNGLYRRLATVIIIFFLLKGLSFGYRNQILQISLTLFALYDSPKIKYWHLFLIGIIPLYLILIFGAIRVNPFILFSDNLNDILLEPINNFGFNLLGNQNDIFYASVRIFGFLEEGIISSYDRVTIAFSNLLAIVVPYSFLPDIANIAGYKQKEYGSLGGTLISMYWYLFAGIPGVLAIGGYLAFLVKKYMTTNNKFFILYFLMVLTTYPRWVGYNQISLFKISIYGVVYYLFLILINKVIFLFKKPQLV